MNKGLLSYLLKYPQSLLQRHTLIDLFTESERIEVVKEKDKLILDIASDPFVGMLVVYNGEFCAITDLDLLDSNKDSQVFKVELDRLAFKATEEALAKTTDEFELRKGDILNFKEDKPIITNVGRYLVNYVLLVDPFQDLIPYQNITLKGAKKLEKLISDNILAGKINYKQERRFGANELFLSSNPEYFAPTITNRVLTTGKDVIKLKYKLFDQYKAELEAGDVVRAAQIEAELVKADKEYCSGDESNIFLMKDNYTANIRKKMFVIHGAVPSFGRKGEYDFIPNSLEEGWTVKDFPKIVNEIRDGTYSRSTEVAKGGEVSNFILRIFQNTRITEDDCGTKHGTEITFDEDNYKSYIDRNVLVNGKTIMLTPENAKSFIGKTVLLRSPMYCTAKNGGVCYKCTDKKFEETKQDALATIMNTLGAMFSTLALKKVHNTAVSSTRLKDLDYYIL